MIKLSLRASSHQDISYMQVQASRLIILPLGTYHIIEGIGPVKQKSLSVKL